MPERATLDRRFEEVLTADRAHFATPPQPGPVWAFGDWQAEYAAFRQAAGLVPWDAHTEVVLSGAERASFLNRLGTNRLDRLAPGHGTETFLTDAKGHVLAHLLVWAESEQLVLTSSGQFGTRILTHLDYYLIREAVELADRSDEVTALGLHGPQAVAVLERMADGPWPTEPLQHRPLVLESVPVAVRAVPYGHEVSYLIVAPREAAADLWSALRHAGAEPCGQRAADVLRIEAGWPWYGVDITEANLPQEIARDSHTLSFTKGCYLGQETVARIDARGHVNQTLVGLRLPGHEPPAAGTVLSVDERPVGRITSAAWSPRSKSVVALGYVRREHNTPGSQVATPQGPAEVVALPMAE